MTKCKICKEHFIKNSFSKVCSLKCRLLEGIKKDLKTQCWNWQKGRNKKYGKVRWLCKTLIAHRASYEEFKGEIPDGLFVCHTCDNPLCINPDHLWLGTHNENIQDAVRKHRMKGTLGIKWTPEWRENILKKRKHPNRKGEAHHLAKLNDKVVKEIREMLKNNISQTKIAEKYGVHPSTISYIGNRKLWPHID